MWFVKTASTFERPKPSMTEYSVGIDVFVSRTVKVKAETIEEARLKAKQALRDLVEQDSLIQVRE